MWFCRKNHAGGIRILGFAVMWSLRRTSAAKSRPTSSDGVTILKTFPNIRKWYQTAVWPQNSGVKWFYDHPTRRSQARTHRGRKFEIVRRRGRQMPETQLKIGEIRQELNDFARQQKEEKSIQAKTIPTKAGCNCRKGSEFLGGPKFQFTGERGELFRRPEILRRLDVSRLI